MENHLIAAFTSGCILHLGTTQRPFRACSGATCLKKATNHTNTSRGWPLSLLASSGSKPSDPKSGFPLDKIDELCSVRGLSYTELQLIAKAVNVRNDTASMDQFVGDVSARMNLDLNQDEDQDYGPADIYLQYSQSVINNTQSDGYETGDSLDLGPYFNKWRNTLAGQEKYRILDPLKVSVQYIRMMNACLRKSPKSWTAALSGLEYYGFQPDNYVRDEVRMVQNKEIVARKVDLDEASLFMAQSMLDIDLDSIREAAAPAFVSMTPLERMQRRPLEESCFKQLENSTSPFTLLSVQDMNLALSRVLIRYALLRDVIRKQIRAPQFQLLEIVFHTQHHQDISPILVPPNSLYNILELDFPELIASAKNFDHVVITASSISAWLETQLSA